MSGQHSNQVVEKLPATQDESGNLDLSPVPSPTEVDDEGDICTNHVLQIRPKSPQALLGFDMLCEMLDSQPLPSEYQHYCKFIVRDSTRSTLREAVNLWDDLASSGDDSVPEDVPEQLLKTGYFVLSYSTPPSRPIFGWRFGYGKPDFGPVDFHVPRHSRWPGLRGYHAAFTVDKQAQLCFEAYRSGVKLDGENVQPGKDRPLSKVVHHITLANVLDYEVRFVCPEESRLYQKEARKLFMQEYLHYTAPNERTPVTPSEYGTQRGNWMIGGIIGQGGNAPHSGRSLVRIGSHCRESQQLVAVKESYYVTLEDHKKVRQEIKTYMQMNAVLLENDEDRNLIVSLLETVPSKLADFVPGNTDSISFIFSPLGRKGLGTTLSKPYGSRLLLFVSLLRAVRFLHKHGIVHRDLKPHNVCVQEEHRVLLIDFGCAVLGKPGDQWEPKPGTCGTIGYLAPELENATYSPWKTYGAAVDMWSVGCIGLELFRSELPLELERTYRHENPFRARDNEREDVRAGRERACKQIQEGVQKLRGNPWYTLENLLGGLLDLSPAERLTAIQALGHRSIEGSLERYCEIMSLIRKDAGRVKRALEK